MAAAGQVDKYCLMATGGALRVTLVWADPPAAAAAAVQLVNDLDLLVHADSLAGRSLYGNGAPDRLNNVEQVGNPLRAIFSGPAARRWQVRVARIQLGTARCHFQCGHTSFGYYELLQGLADSPDSFRRDPGNLHCSSF